MYPLSHGLRRASSPKGTPFGNAVNFAFTAKSRPLGEGGKAVGFDGRGTVPGREEGIKKLPLAGERARRAVLEGSRVQCSFLP